MFSNKFLTISFAAVCMACNLTAAERLDLKIRTDFFAGFAGDSAALDRGMALAEKEIADHPQTAAEALSWHGSGLLFRSGLKFRQGDMPGGMELWMRANAEMDKAGALDPDNIAVLIPRAAAWFAASRTAPPPMATPIIAKALADFEKVYEKQQDHLDTLGTHPEGELLFGLADGYNRSGNPEKARFYFEKLLAMQPPSGHAEQARQYLDGNKYTVQGAGCIGCHTPQKQSAKVN